MGNNTLVECSRGLHEGGDIRAIEQALNRHKDVEI